MLIALAILVVILVGMFAHDKRYPSDRPFFKSWFK